MLTRTDSAAHCALILLCQWCFLQLDSGPLCGLTLSSLDPDTIPHWAMIQVLTTA